MFPIRTLLCAACLLAGLVPASGHHGASPVKGAYLAFWGAYEAPAAADLSTGACQDGRFWEKGFVSIYSQGDRGTP